MIRLRWARLWQRLGAVQVPDIAPLLARLRESHRHYHNLSHVRHCLSVYDHGPRRDDVVELALWLHDAIYDPQARDNEERSADWCTALVRDAGVAATIGERAHACILATRHRQVPTNDDECLTVSIDLTILGETAARFRRYDRDIRREYAWVPLDAYRPERARVLCTFLERPAIFPSPWFEQRFSHRARINLRQALAKKSFHGLFRSEGGNRRARQGSGSVWSGGRAVRAGCPWGHPLPAAQRRVAVGHGEHHIDSLTPPQPTSADRSRNRP